MNEIFECLKKETENKLKKSETLVLATSISIMLSPFDSATIIVANNDILNKIEALTGVEHGHLEKIMLKHINALTDEIKNTTEKHMIEKIKKDGTCVDSKELKEIIDILWN